MSRLRTINIPGHTYFVTTKVTKGLSLLLNDYYCQIIIINFNFYRRTKEFLLLG